MQSLAKYQQYFSQKLEQKNTKIHRETQKTMNSQRNLDKEEQSW